MTLRAALRLIAVITGSWGLGYEYWHFISAPGAPPLFAASADFFSYFSIITNCLVIFALAVPCLIPGSKTARFLSRGGVRTAIAVYICVVGFIYHFIIRLQWEPHGLLRAADFILHYGAPALFISDWAIFGNKAGLKFSMIPSWLVYPTGYGVYSLLRGALTGVYPYSFLDAATLGYTAVILNIIGMLVFFASVSGLFIVIGRALPGKNR